MGYSGKGKIIGRENRSVITVGQGLKRLKTKGNTVLHLNGDGDYLDIWLVKSG